MASRRRTIVGSPLTPGLLKQLGLFSEFPPPPDGFEPGGNWVNTYRVWTCHGYRKSGNHDVGFLRIERGTGTPNGTFTLKADQQIDHTEAALNIIHAEIECRRDALASPLHWRLSSRFVGPEGKARSGLDADEQVRVNGDTIEVTTNERTFKREGSSRLTADWCLFEAVQRLPFETESHLAFDVLEGLSLLKRDHRLSYRGAVTMTPENDMTLHGFHQLGHGTLPYEYWLDRHHRLVLAVTLSRVYILDDKAEEKTAAEIRRGRNEFHRMKRAYERGGVR